MNIPENGFITRDGELVSLHDVDRMLSILTRRTENKDQIAQAIRGLAGECLEVGYLSAAIDYYEKVLVLVDTPAEKAECLLAMGQALERAGDHRAALAVYSRAFELPLEPDPVWYFLNNNLGYCLNHQGRFQEAEIHCRAAIEIETDRHNAHKNLGVALQGQGRYSEAAQSFMTATILCPSDGRALGHLEDLIAAHGEILEQEPELLDQLQQSGLSIRKPSVQ